MQTATESQIYNGDYRPHGPENIEESFFSVKGESQRCEEIIATGRHILIGISPFNSRFSEPYISAVMSWAADRFEQIDILLPCETEASRLLTATGNTPEKALKKTRREIRRHMRYLEPLQQAFGERGFDVRVVQFSDYAADNSYCALYQQVLDAYRSSADFADTCRDMARQAIMGRLRGIGAATDRISDAEIDLALPYIFAEMPFYLDGAGLLGKDQSVLVYHRPWPIGTGLFSGAFPIRVAPRQGYGILTQNP